MGGLNRELGILADARISLRDAVILRAELEMWREGFRLNSGIHIYSYFYMPAGYITIGRMGTIDAFITI